MTLVRCSEHPIDRDRAKHDYGYFALPVGYPDTSAICGAPGCYLAGRVWLNSDEVILYRSGERVFGTNTNTCKLHVADDTLTRAAFTE